MLLSRNLLLAILVNLAVGVSSAPASKPPSNGLICPEGSTSDNDCYPLNFEPTNQYKAIREGQQIPQGLDIKLDWQTGEKFAKLPEGGLKKGMVEKSKEIAEVVEEDKNKIVSYSDEDEEEDADLIALKKSFQSHSKLDLDDSLELLLNSNSDKDLIEGLESLSEHSHNLKDGILITEPVYFNKLVKIIDSEKTSLKELSLRIIAQSLRHNKKALQNIDIDTTLPTFLQLLAREKNSVLQKRILGVISSLVQSEEGSRKFEIIDGESVLLDQLKNLKEDSKVRSLQILDDVKKSGLTKRDTSKDLKLFKSLQESFKNNEIIDEHSLEYLFDKLVELKTENKDFQVSQGFLEWLISLISSKSLVKRDENGVQDDALHKKLLEARHVVFGNPNALRKALTDEL